MYRTDLVIVSGADLEYAKKLLKFHGEWCCIGVYNCKIRNGKNIKSARLSDKANSWREYIQIIIHVYLFFMCKTL